MLQKIRVEKGLSQSQLSELSGVNLRMIQHYEQGVKNIDQAALKTLCALAGALGCPLWDVLNDTELKDDLKKVTTP